MDCKVWSYTLGSGQNSDSNQLSNTGIFDCTNLSYPSQRSSLNQALDIKALGNISVLIVVWALWMWSHFSASPFYFYKLSINWEQGPHFYISCVPPTSVQFSACLSYVIDLRQKFFLWCHLILPGWICVCERQCELRLTSLHL